MGKKLYVGNLGSSITREMLETLFSTVGKVESVNVIMDKYTGQPRGFGFVEMSNNQEAQEAINKLNGQSLGDRTITVNEARAEERRGGGAGGARRGGFGGGERRRRY
ncbi:MAG TPA: RNA recognition motif domain-containing protein [Candidatus Hypogeohydataceae bacterium YC41]